MSTTWLWAPHSLACSGTIRFEKVEVAEGEEVEVAEGEEVEVAEGAKVVVIVPPLFFSSGGLPSSCGKLPLGHPDRHEDVFAAKWLPTTKDWDSVVC